MASRKENSQEKKAGQPERQPWGGGRKMKRTMFILLLSAVCQQAFPQATPGDITIPPKKVELHDGYLVYPFSVKIDLGDRELRRTVYSLPPWAHEAAYELFIDESGVVLKTVTNVGIQYGTTSLSQMLATSDTLRCCYILDYPSEKERVRQYDLGAEDASYSKAELCVDIMGSLKENVLVLMNAPGALSERELTRLIMYAEKKYIKVRLR